MIYAPRSFAMGRFCFAQKYIMIKGSTVLKLYDKIEEVQREYEHLDNKLTLMEYNFI